MPHKTLSELVKGRRMAEGFSQQILAKKVGVTRGTISQIESGETLRPTTAVLIGLAKGLHIRIDDLIDSAGVSAPRGDADEPLGTWAQIEAAIEADCYVTPEERRGLMLLLTSVVKPILATARDRPRDQRRATAS